MKPVSSKQDEERGCAPNGPLYQYHDPMDAKAQFGRKLFCIVLAAIVLIMTVPPLHRRGPEVTLADCLVPLGGGAAQKGGSFSHFSYPSCKLLLDEYFAPDGLYYKQLEHVASAALKYMKQRSQTPSKKQVFVFDIDETALSNAVEWLATSSSQQQHNCAFRRFWQWLTNKVHGLHSCGRSHGSSDGNSSPTRAPPQQWLGLPAALRGDADNASDRPALVAVRDLYWWLTQNGYSVAFITGRKEAARAATIKNLEFAGYGKQCDDADPVVPCYVALHLRTDDDDRPASVYKPERRKALMDAGYEVVGNIGDQFSDLEGLWVAQSSWKLPNPIYYIL